MSPPQTQSGADGGADDPVGFNARLVQRLIDAALIGPSHAPKANNFGDLAMFAATRLASSNVSTFAMSASAFDSPPYTSAMDLPVASFTT